MAEFDDLISEFGSKGKASSAGPVVTPHADLIAQFGSGKIQAAAPETVADTAAVQRYGIPAAEVAAAEQAAVPSVAGFEQSKALQRQTQNELANRPIEVGKLPVARQIGENYTSAANMAGEGYSDIAQNRPLGVGKVALGHALQLASPLTGPITAANEAVTKMTGNKEFADRAELALTSGLPVAGMAKVATGAMPTTRAMKTLIESVGPENIPKVVEALKSNPRLTLMDVDPNAQIIAQGLAAKPGQPRNILDDVVKGRSDTKLDTVKGAINDTMGVPVNVADKIESLNAQIRAVGKEINPVIEKTGAVNITPVVNAIDMKLNPGVGTVLTHGQPLPLGDIEKQLEGVKKFITDGKSFRTDPQSLHVFQSALRSKADDLLASSSGQDRQLGKALMDIRNQVVDAIDKASPQITDAAGNVTGSYRPALAKYRDVNDIKDSFKKGTEITKNRSGYLDDDPSYWEKWVKQAVPEELEAAREGARLAYDRQMRAVKNAAKAGTDIPLVDFNVEKLKLLFGEKEVNAMNKALRDEWKISDTDSKLMQGSMTAMRLLGADATKVRPDYSPGFTKHILPIVLEVGGSYLSGGSLPMAGVVAGVGYNAARSKLTKMGQSRDMATNEEIAKLASATGPARDELIKALQAAVPQPKLSLKQKSQLFLPVANP